MEEVVRIDLGRVCRALWKGKGRILLAGLVCAALIFGGYLVRGPRFEMAVTFFAETPERARQAAVLLELEQTVSEIEAAAEVEVEQLQAEEVRETGFLRVTVTSQNPADGKAAAEAVLAVLPRRAEEVLGFGVTAADAGMTEEKPMWTRALAGFLLGLFGCGGLVAGVEVFEEEKWK